MKKNLFLLLLFIHSSLMAGNRFFESIRKTNGHEESVMIFYRPTCPHCQNMENIISKDNAMQTMLSTRFNFEAVDVTSNEGRQLSLRYKITAVPTIILLDDNRTEIKRLIGFGSKSRFVNFLENESPIVLQKSSPVLIPNSCGNGIIEAGETCDDGNTISGDGCSSTCQVEDNWTCKGAPSKCLRSNIQKNSNHVISNVISTNITKEIAISVTIEQPSEILLQLNDLQGKVVQSLQLPGKTVGSRNIIFNLSNQIQPGEYLLAILVSKDKNTIRKTHRITKLSMN